MTDQELFDKVAAHLREQNAKALNNDGTCMYRALDGKRCAAGCLILDEHYSPSSEGKSALQQDVWGSLRASGVADSQSALVQSLQNTHDHSPVYQWESELTRVAERFCLTPPGRAAHEGPLFGGHPRNHLFGCAYKNKPALGVAACDCGAYSPPAAP